MTAIILVEPESSDNIGAVARAMKNMGLSDLRLVLPPEDFKAQGKKMAMSAQDTLRRAKVFKSLKKACEDLQFMIGTSRRLGRKRGYSLEFSDAIQKLSVFKVKSGIVFGKESKGLANADLSLCDAVVTIPSSPKYPSLNLAQAVMVFAFGLYFLSSPRKRGSIVRAMDSRFRGDDKWRRLVPKSRIDCVLQLMSDALNSLNYHPKVRERILVTFSNLLKRGGLEQPEAQMFTGLFRRIEKHATIRP